MVAVLPARSEIRPEHTWNAPSVFGSAEEWAAELEAVSSAVDRFGSLKDRLADSAATLAEGLIEAGRLAQRADKLTIYAGMLYSCDTTDHNAAGINGQAAGLNSRLAAATAFIEPTILAIGRVTLDQWIADEARLTPYRHYVDSLFRRQQFVRSSDVEEAINLTGNTAASIAMTASMLTNADLKFAPATSSTGESLPVTQGTMNALMVNPDREVRRTAWEHYMDGYLNLKNGLSSNLMASINYDAYLARVRGYATSLEAMLFPNAISTDVFHNLLNTFKRHMPVWQRYVALRKKALGLAELHPYDIWAPLTSSESTVTYEQAVDMITQGMRPLGETYVNTVRRGCLQDRWVDIYPNAGKRQGAFSWGTQGTHPFIMMSFSGDLKSMSTLAHELGHSMHSYLTWQHQPWVYSNYALFVAEVASNFNQAMVRAHLLKTNPDPVFQIALIEEAMSNFHRYFLVMPTLARFELDMHTRAEQGKGATAADMIALTADLFAEAYGPDMHVDRDRLGITYATFNHLYSGYYVFQYATGISGAHALSQRILDGVPGAVEDYLGFLSAGSSLYPLDALKRAGVDLITSEAVEKTFGVLTTYVDRLETLLAGQQQ